MLRSIFLAASVLFVAVVCAAPTNDWSKPCFNGVCSYDQPVLSNGRNVGSSGSMTIWGSSDAISDITEAGGWRILGCDSTKMAQTIRLVCMGNDQTRAGCNNLFKTLPAEGKIVRLPENCGKMPFARVAKHWISEDQSVPQSVMRPLARQDGTPPQVHALALDINWAAVDPTKTGPVNFVVSGSNVPEGAASSQVLPPVTAPRRRSRFANRGFFDDVGDAAQVVGNAAGAVKDGAESAAGTVKNAAEDLGDAVGGVAKDGAKSVKNSALKVVDVAGGAAAHVRNFVSNAVKNFQASDKSITKTLPPVDIQQVFPIIDTTISCPATNTTPQITSSFKANVDTKAHAVITVGAAGSGTIIPPNLGDFAVFASLDADIDGVLHLNASTTGTLDSGAITLFEVGIPGLDFPGILTVGPSFKLNGQVIANLEVDIGVAVSLAYTVRDASFVFPAGATNTTGGDFQPADSNFQLSAKPSVAAKGTVEGHLIPTIDLGINVLDGVAEATVFLNLDASATVGIELNTSAEFSNKVGLKGAGVNGCFDVKSGLSVNAGADASFFGLFDAGTKVPLFGKEFELFKKCFGSGIHKSLEAPGPKRSIPVSSDRRHTKSHSSFQRRAGLTCPTQDGAESAFISLANEVVKGTFIKQI